VTIIWFFFYFTNDAIP